MSHSRPTADTTADPRTPFERFRDLTQSILTTPKAELVKPAAKPKAAKPPAKKRK